MMEASEAQKKEKTIAMREGGWGRASQEDVQSELKQEEKKRRLSQKRKKGKKKKGQT